MPKPFTRGDPGQAGGAYSTFEQVSIEEATARDLARRAEWAARPETIASEQTIEAGRQQRRLERQASRSRGDFIGPPDPRKGRAPMTR